MKKGLVTFGLAFVVVAGVGMSIGWPGYEIVYPCACGDEFAYQYYNAKSFYEVALKNYKISNGRYPTYAELLSESKNASFYSDEMLDLFSEDTKLNVNYNKDKLVEYARWYFEVGMSEYSASKIEPGIFYQVLENGQKYKIRGFKEGRRTYDGGVYMMINALHDWTSPKILGELVRYANEEGETKYKYEQVELVK